MDLNDGDVHQHAEADRREVDPPIQPRGPRGPELASSIGGGKNGGNGGVAYAVPTAVNGGSQLLIFVWPARLILI
jgi:hypothetical protein